MKQSPGMPSQSESRFSSMASSLTSSTKYGGLIEVPIGKQIRNSLFQLITYFDTTVPPLYAMHTIISIFRILQYLGPSFVSNFGSLYPKGSLSAGTIGVVSVLYQLFPSFTPDDVSVIFMYVYAGLFLVFYIVFFVSSFYYRKTAQLSRAIAMLLSLFLYTFGYVLHPIAAQCAAVTISRLIMGTTDVSLILAIIGIVLSVIVFGIYAWIQVSVCAHTITFRPDSLQAVEGQAAVKVFMYTILNTMLLGIASELPMIGKIVICVVSIGVYIGARFHILVGAAFIKRGFTNATTACSIAGSINLAIAIVYEGLGKSGGLELIVIYIVVVLLSFLVASFWHQKIISKQLLLLDDLEASQEEIAELRSPNQFLEITLTGFIYNHNLCLSFEIFKLGLDAWEDDIAILTCYAKFLAIYPDATKTLAMVQQRLSTVGMKSGQAKQTIHQIVVIIDQRENILSPSLKKKLNTVQKKTNAAKRKMLGIWDFVIQSNINELDGAIDSSYRTANIAERELFRLKADYPNNTFVSRAYSRFMHDIRCDEKVVAEEAEKVRKLRRGILAVPDRSHNLGIYSFPNLPQQISMLHVEKNQTIDFGTSDTTENIDEEGVPVDMEENDIMRKRIETIKVPSVRNTIWMVVLATIILVLIPIILLIAMNSIYVDSIFEPVSFMDALSMMRNLNFAVASYTYRIALEELPDLNDPSLNVSNAAEYYEGYYPTNLGNSRNTREQLSKYVARIGTTLSEANLMRDFNVGEENMDMIRSMLFSPYLEYKYYTSADTYENTTLSVANILMDTALQGSRVLDSVITRASLQTVQFLNPRMNSRETGDALDLCLSYFTKFIISENSTFQIIFLALQIAYSVLVAVVFFAALAYSITRHKKDTREVYKALTMLPKSVVSQAAESQRVIKKGSSDNSINSSDINKQEENIIKVFMGAADSSSGGIGNTITQAISIVIIIAMGVVGVNVLVLLYSDQYQILVQSAPHVDYVLGVAAYIHACMLSTNSLALALSGYDDIDADPTTHIADIDRRLSRFKTYYNSMRYGGTTADEPPYVGFSTGSNAANELLMCANASVIPVTFADMYSCAEADFQVTLYSLMIVKLLEPYRADHAHIFTGQDSLVSDVWVLGPIVVYDTFLYPMYNQLQNDVSVDINGSVNMTTLIMIPIMVVAILFLLIIIYELQQNQKRIRFTLTLLLHVNPAVVMSTPKIVSILGGNFNDSEKDVSARSSKFFEQVVEKLINAVLVLDEQDKLLSINAETEKAFGINREDFIGQPIASFLNSERFGGDIAEFLVKPDGKSVTLTYKTDTYELSGAAVKGGVILTMKNETARVNHSKLIAEERSKSDKMLSSILPAALVPRVQAGEANISFAVQSASILFLDIVSFTPWCGANTASYVMKVLNRLFKDLDAILQEFPTMTKVKCIGDCYMAAGGIFSEVNQPSQHAREVVQFGLRAIKAVEQIDSDLNEKLQIRVGVNTGGPLAAGVIGTGKPTFEILGPCINLAQQMEHHGVPMNVHISRATYELIYGSAFTIKERGEVEVKQGRVSTYLVSE